MQQFIQSASGWRKIFAKSGDEYDKCAEISLEDAILAQRCAGAFLDFLCKKGICAPTIVVGRDTRPTGVAIMQNVLAVLQRRAAKVLCAGVVAAPEIMAFANAAIHEKKCDAFIYISASHNPIGHNGLKFGMIDGGVLSASDNALLQKIFDTLPPVLEPVSILADSAYLDDASSKQDCLSTYLSFALQKYFGDGGKTAGEESKKVNIVADLNGGARCLSIDAAFFKKVPGVAFEAINSTAGKISHGIIPEGKNLCALADFVSKKAALFLDSNKIIDHPVIVGYACDCDGDRGNIVFWDKTAGVARVLRAQETFALATLGALSAGQGQVGKKRQGLAVCVNCATSMRVDELAKQFGASVFHCEVGEANVVNLARRTMEAGFAVPIAGEGSNGGVIVPPGAVRDPLDTISMVLKTLSSKKIASIEQAIALLPQYTTTETEDPRAKLHVKTADSSLLKERFQKIFESEWATKKDELRRRWGLSKWEAVGTVGTTESRNLADFSKSKSGGLKVVFKDEGGADVAFFWMRKSGTENVFRVLVDAKGVSKESVALHDFLLQWEGDMIQKADALCDE